MRPTSTGERKVTGETSGPKRMVLRLGRGHHEGEVGLERVLLGADEVVVGAEDGGELEALGEREDVAPALPGEPVLAFDHESDAHWLPPARIILRAL